jgi:hypothetical protein
VQAKIDVNDLDILTLVLSAVSSAFNTNLQELVFLLVSSLLSFLVYLCLRLLDAAALVCGWPFDTEIVGALLM